MTSVGWFAAGATVGADLMFAFLYMVGRSMGYGA